MTALDHAQYPHRQRGFWLIRIVLARGKGLVVPSHLQTGS